MANTSKSTKKTAKRAGTSSSGSRSNGARRTTSRTATSRNAGREENDEYNTSARTSSERNSGDRERSYEDDYSNSRYRGRSNDGEEGDLSRKNPGEDAGYHTSQQDRPYGDDWGYRQERTPYGENWGNEDRSTGSRRRNNEGRSSSFNQDWSQRDDERNRRSYDDQHDLGRGQSRRQERYDYDDNRGYGQSSQRDRSYTSNQDRYMDNDRSWSRGGYESDWQNNRNSRNSFDDQYGRERNGNYEGYERRAYGRNDEWRDQPNRRGGMSLYNQDDNDMRRGRNESDWNMGRSRYEDQDRGYDRNRDEYSGRQSYNQGNSRYMDDWRSEGRRDEGRYQDDRRNRRDRF